MADAHGIISSVLEELDREHSVYQALHNKYHRCEDETAKHVHRRLVELCKRLLRMIPKGPE
jgi:hypothetical protein